MTNKLWTKKEVKLLEENYVTNGVFFCVKKLGRSIQSVTSKAHDLKLTSSRFWKKDEEEFLKLHYPTKGEKFCAKELDKTHSSIANKVNKLKLAKRKREVDGEKFIKMDTPESAYLAGFIFADGYIEKRFFNTVLSICSEDMNEISSLFDKFGEWTFYYPKRKINKFIITICTNNKEIYNFFCDMGYKEKSYIEPTKILNIIPEHLHRYFWRGFSDGDGHWACSKYMSGFSVTGNIKYEWKEMMKLFDKLDIKTYSLYKNSTKYGDCSRLCLHRHEFVKKFGEYIYQNYENDRIGLPRKYEIFEKLEKKNVKARNLSHHKPI